MKYLAMVLTLLTWAAPAQAAIYRFDAYVEENSWTCWAFCSDSDGNNIPTPEPKHGVLEGQTYTGFLEVNQRDEARIWLSTSPQSFSLRTLDWTPYLGRYDFYTSGWIEYFEFDITQGTGKYFLENDASPFYQKTDLRLSNISQVPLPASGLMLLTGLGGLILRHRFQRAL